MVVHGLWLCKKCWFSDHLGPSYGPPTEEVVPKLEYMKGLASVKGWDCSLCQTMLQ